MIIDSFEEKYEIQEREYLVLMGKGAGSSDYGPYVIARAYFLGYMDTMANELKSGEGRLVWPVESKEAEKEEYFDRFEEETIYRIKARRLIKAEIPKDMQPSCYNNLYVTEVLEEGARCKVLEDILADYRKPVILQDDVLGELLLDKDLSLLEGSAIWSGKKIKMTLDIDSENRATGTKARNAMKKLLAEQQSWDIAMRDLAASKLTSLANKWQEEENENAPDILEKDFAGRITMESILITSGGSFSACFNDDDMFGGQIITVEGSLEKGVKHASIEGYCVRCQNHIMKYIGDTQLDCPKR